MAKSTKINKLEQRAYPQERVLVAEAVLQEALSHYEKGKYVDAYRTALQAGPLHLWRGVEAQVFGFRLANNVGAARLGSLLICRAKREEPQNAEAQVHYGYYLHHRHGPLPTWRHCAAAESLPSMQPDLLSDLKAQRAGIAAGYRDFDTAWRLWNEAVAIHQPTPWLHVEKCTLLLHEERREEALTATEEALGMKPWFRPAVQYRARLLHLLGRGEEAISFLSEAMNSMQSCAIAAQLMSLKREVDDHAGMELLADEYEKLAVLGDSTSNDWLAARRADLLTLRGDFSRAAVIAASLPSDYYKGLAKRLEAPGATNLRQRLPFEFVHQKHNTCAPATLAALANFWKRPVPMEQITEAICYDGTQDHNERAWAVEHGYFVREFTVTIDSTRQLIDYGVPFVLHTVETTSGHAQAVIGYDLLRETLFIQDPSEPHYREIEAAEFFANYKLTGPRGMVMAPADLSEKIHALNLPDAEVYDISHRFNAALATHDRSTAVAMMSEMEACAPGHRLILIAQMSLANFDGDEVERLNCINRLLEHFPSDPRLLAWKNSALGSMGRREERLQLLRDAVKEIATPTALSKNLVDALMEDARDWDEARLLARRVHARMPGDPGGIVSLAEVLRRTQRAPADEWLTFLRFAAALADKTENVVLTWFAHAQAQGHADEALDWLRRRWRDYGAKSGGPAITLAQALDSMCLPEAIDVLREAVQSRPEDGDLLICLSRVETRLGNHAEALELLNRAKDRCSPRLWLRASAALNRRFGDHLGEMAVWRQILEKEPLALDAHGWISRELAATRGQDAAVNHLAEVCARFPHHHGLAQLHIHWLREENGRLAEKEIRRVAALHPADPWTWRELALLLRDLGRAAEAVEPAMQSCVVAPDQAASHGVFGFVLASCGREAEAIKSFQTAIRLDVNYPSSFEGLLSLCYSTAAKRESLAFIRGEMIRQVLNGNALHSYQGLAFTVLTQEELLAEVREMWQARPDLWEAWSVLIAQMIDSGQKNEAILLAQQATQKFALTPGSWRDMALVWRATERPDAAIACARHVVNLNADWVEGWCLLAEYQENADQGDEAVKTLLLARTRLPLDMTIRRALANLLWRMHRREEAWQLAENAVKEDPGQNWAWSSLKNWADTLRRSDRLIDAARNLTQARPDEARSWLLLAKLLPLENISEILEALDHATTLNPRLVDAWDFRMETLARLSRLDEATSIPAKGPWREEMPQVLRGRLAWLQAVRGNLPEAMRQMRAVLDQQRAYYWGWEMYAQWAEQRADLKEWKLAAAEMIRLSPRSSSAHCAAADAALGAGEREAGILHLQQALHVEAGSAYAAHRLLGLYWEKREIEALRSTAAALPHIGQPALICRVYLMLAAAHKDDLEQVSADLALLAVHPDMMGELLNLILDYFTNQKRKLAPVLDKALSTAAEDNTIGPAFAMLWTLRETQQLRWHCWSHFAEWLPRLGSRLDPAISLYLDSIGKAGAGKSHVSNFIKACEPQLRRSGDIWGQVSFALASSGAFQACADWLEPDYLRDDAKGWTLWNLALSLRELLRPERAEEVCLHVITKGIRDSTWNAHSVIAAMGYAWKEDYAKALLLLKDTDINDDLESRVRLSMIITRALCDVMPKPPGEGRARYKQFVSDCNQYFLQRAISPQDKLDFERAMRIMREHTGATTLPWQRPKPRAEVMPQHRVRIDRQPQPSSGSGGLTKATLCVLVLVSINLLRQCGPSLHDSGTRPYPVPGPPTRYSLPSPPSLYEPPFQTFPSKLSPQPSLFEQPSQTYPYTLPPQPPLYQPQPSQPPPRKSPENLNLDKQIEELLRKSQTLPAPMR